MSIASLLEPKSIAVVGASTQAGSVGNDIVKNLVTQGFQGKVFPVNPKTSELYGVSCFPNVSSIEDDIECVVIAVPASIVPQVLREAVEKGIRAAIVVSAGFGESGHEDLEQEIASIAERGGISLLGPNCLGVVNPSLSLNASFARTLPKRGGVAFLSQSGALGTAILDAAGNYGIGISKFVSLGNKARLDEQALLEYLAQDRKTKVIAIYAESFRNPGALKRIARKMAMSKRPKPIIVLKSGRTNAGASALASHTGALAGNDASYQALFEESGILRAETVEELFLLARAFSLAPIPKGRHVAILTNAGGPGVLAADAAISSGLVLAPMSEKTKNSLRSFLPEAASVKNPVDILGDARSDRYLRALSEVLADSEVRSVLVLLTPQSMTDIEAIADSIAEEAKKHEKPVVAVFMGGKLVSSGLKTLLRKKIPTASFPEAGICMLSALARFSEWCGSIWSREAKSYAYAILPASDRIRKEQAKDIVQAVRDSGRHMLSPVETLDFFSSYGFPIPKYGRALTLEDAVRVAGEIGGECAMKILSDDITHKTDSGGVSLGVRPEQAGAAFSDMMKRVQTRVPDAQLDGVLLMEMAASGGFELILGSFRDSNLGNTIMIGAGGIYSETLKDTAFGLAPVDRDRAGRMISSLRVAPILSGARGKGALDMAAFIECIGRLSELLADFPEIRELDMNPVLVYENRVVVVDGRVMLD